MAKVELKEKEIPFRRYVLASQGSLWMRCRSIAPTDLRNI